MAGAGGYFLQGLSGGLQTGFNMGQRMQEMKWKKDQMKKLEEKEAKLAEGGALYSNLVKQLGADGHYSEDDMMKLNTCYWSLGYEIQAIVKDSHNAITTMNKDKLEQDFKWFDMTLDMITSGQLDPEDATALLEFGRENWTNTDKGKSLYTAYDSMQQKRKAPPEDIWAQAGKLPQEIRPEFLRARGEEIPEAPPTERAPDIMEREIAGIDKLEKAGVITKEQANQSRLKIYGGVLPEKPAAAGVAPAAKVSAPPVPTTTENVREDILEADTFEDAQRIHKNYMAKYGEGTLGIPDVKEYWVEGQTAYLDNINRALQSIINEKGWLKTGTLTEDEVGIEFKGDRKTEEIYEELREQYMRYRDMLEKMGTDVSQYPKIKPLTEIEKVGFVEGLKAFGVGRGQYKSIYY